MRLFRRRRDEPDPPSAEAVEEGAVAVALVLADDDAELTPTALEAAWARVWPERAGPADLEVADAALTCTLDGAGAGAAVLPAPVPTDELDPVVSRSPLWRDAATAVAAHSRHVVVFAHADTPLGACVATTRLTCAVLEAVGGLGVYWGAAPQLVRRDAFVELAAAATDVEPPVLLWVRIGARTEDDGTTTVRTTGMRQLGLMEVEATGASLTAEELHRIVAGVVEYLAVHGPVIADGDTIGGTQAARIAVVHAASELEPDETVYRLAVD